MTAPLAAIRRELEGQLAALPPPSAVRHFSVAGVNVEVRVHGEELAVLSLPAFDACPPTESGTPPVVLHAWDHAATSTAVPEQVTALRQPGHNPRYVDGINHLILGDGVCELITEGEQPPTALFTVESAALLPSFHRGSPLSLLLASLLGRHGRPFVHAACVGLPDAGGLLLAGRSGSGKSTTALRCLLAGWSYVGDDYVVLDPDNLAAHLLYATAKLAPIDFHDDTSVVPPGVPLCPDPLGVDKTIALLWPAYQARMPFSLPLRAVVAPRVGSGPRTSWRRASSGRGLMALAPSTLIQLPMASAARLAPLSLVARSLPAVEMELGSDPGGVVAAMAEVLHEVHSWT